MRLKRTHHYSSNALKLRNKEGQVSDAINVQKQYMEIPINKVCDYWEEFRPVASAKQVRLYVLWQIADDGRFEPRFEDFTNCQ